MYRIYTVSYCIGEYGGTLHVTAHEDEENEAIVARARKTLQRLAGPLPSGAESWKIVDWKEAPS